ncbi:MAG: ParB N-terminal domain-containing protein [Clostridia bacterium]|nr:ParB N-terminal domain-containing protein [Clostridia bacterium]
MGRKNRNARQRRHRQRKTMRAPAAQANCAREGLANMEPTVMEQNQLPASTDNHDTTTKAEEEKIMKKDRLPGRENGQIAMDGVMEPQKFKNVEQNIWLIPLGLIRTEIYQRVLNMKNVNRIVKEFNPAKLGVLVVSKRDDGTYSVLDGQHRLTALRRLGFSAANCIVLENMTVQEEADYFRRQNENKQNLRIADTFNASLYAEDEESLEIKRLMDKYGFRFGKSGSPMCICAIGALQTIIRTYDVQTLENVLCCIAGTWPKDATILRREMLAGLAEFWHRFADAVPQARFEQRMAARAPAAMYQELTMRTKGRTSPTMAFNRNNRFACCGVLVDNYNRKLRAGSANRLVLEWADGREA